MFESIKSSAAFQRFERATEPILAFLLKCLRDWSLNFAGMISYNLLISIVPMVVAMFGIIGLLVPDPEAQKSFADKFVNTAPGDSFSQTATQEVVNLAFLELSADAGVLLAIGIILAIFGASRLFIAIDRTLTIIYRVPDRPVLRRNLVAMGMAFLFIILFIIMIATNSGPSFAVVDMESASARWGIYIAGFLSSLLVIFILFELIYWLVPNKKMLFKNTWCGALVAAFLFEIVIMWFPLYIEDNTNSYTGIVGLLILFILALYYFSLILILGAQINAFCFEHYLPLESGGLGTCISQMYDKQMDDDSRKPLVDENADTIPLQYQ